MYVGSLSLRKYRVKKYEAARHLTAANPATLAGVPYGHRPPLGSSPAILFLRVIPTRANRHRPDRGLSVRGAVEIKGLRT